MFSSSLSSRILLKNHFHCSLGCSVMVESVLFSLPDFVRSLTNICDCGRPSKPEAIIRVRYHESEEIHLALRERRSHCADRYLVVAKFALFWEIFQILLRGKSKISAEKFFSRQLLKPFEVLINFWVSVNVFIVVEFNLLNTDLNETFAHLSNRK